MYITVLMAVRMVAHSSTYGSVYHSINGSEDGCPVRTVETNYHQKAPGMAKIEARLFVCDENGEWETLFTGTIDIFTDRKYIVLRDGSTEYVLQNNATSVKKSGNTVLILSSDKQHALSFNTGRNRDLYYDFYVENVDFDSLDALRMVLSMELSELGRSYVINKVIRDGYIHKLVDCFDIYIFMELINLESDHVIVNMMEYRNELTVLLSEYLSKRECIENLSNQIPAMRASNGCMAGPDVSVDEFLHLVPQIIKNEHAKEYIVRSRDRLESLFIIKSVEEGRAQKLDNAVLVRLLPHVSSDINALQMLLKHSDHSIFIEMFRCNARNTLRTIHDMSFFHIFAEYAIRILTYDENSRRITVLEILKEALHIDDDAFLVNLYTRLHDILLIREYYSDKEIFIDEVVYSTMIHISTINYYYTLDFFMCTDLLVRMINKISSGSTAYKIFVMRILINMLKNFKTSIIGHISACKHIFAETYASTLSQRNMLFSLMCRFFIITKPYFSDIVDI